MHRVLQYDLSRFRYNTIEQLCLDLGTAEINAMLDQCVEDGVDVEVLVIDPRWKALKQDSNQDSVVRSFCVNLDIVIRKYNLAVVVVHHEGVATASDKAGKGSSVFEAWLNGWWKIQPSGTALGHLRTLDIWSRDSEREQFTIELDYPIFKVRPEIIAQRKAKTIKVKELILTILNDKGGEKLEADVRFEVLAARHSEYAYWRARKELVEEGQITVLKAEGQGNRKQLRISGPATDIDNM